MACRRSLAIVVLALFLVLPLHAATMHSSNPLCDENVSLHTFIAEVGNYSKQKPRACVEYCYGRYVSSSAFTAGSALDREQFLFEYLQACLDAAREPVRTKFLLRAIEVARQYIDWFILTRGGNQSLAVRNVHLYTVVYELGDSYKELNDWTHLLDEYDDYATKAPDALRDERAVDRWLTALRTYKSKTGTERTLAESREALGTQRDDWDLFRKTITTLQSGSHAHGYADAIEFAESVLGTQGRRK